LRRGHPAAAKGDVMNRPLDALVPAASSRMAPSVGIATGLVAPLALGAPGNLDTTFADHGRAVLETEFGGNAWTVEALADGGVFVAGGDMDVACDYYWSYYCEYYGSSFTSELSAEGEIDPSANFEKVDGIEVRDAVRQPDGKVVLVGRRINYSRDMDTLAVYRLQADGSLDTAFGANGIFELPAGEHGDRHRANSVALDPDGRIVVAGSGGENLLVLGLLSDGTLDASFGDDGAFVGPLHDYDSVIYIERAASGGYRLTSTSESRCHVLGLTAGGALDNAFGDAGLVPVEVTPDAPTSCGPMVSQADGSLLVAGTSDEQAFATRLLATGALDATFNAASVATTMDIATAVAVDGDDRFLVAGIFEESARILRLNADGSADGSFGEAGTTLIDLPSEEGSRPRINAMDALSDGRVLAAGGDSYSNQPFVIQLHSDGAVDSPGVLGFTTPYLEATEGGDLVVKVRRTGGKSGSVSVDYATLANAIIPATPGEDYDEVTGTLTWGDGDASEREIAVPVHANSPEEYEDFRITLSNLQGGAGLGQKTQVVTIPADGAPAGQFQLELELSTVRESQLVHAWVYRNFYSEGAVSVTVTPVAGTATADDDFVATPVTLTWEDQDTEPKFASFRANDDDEAEDSESITIELSNPTGGAIIGAHGSRQVMIEANDRQNSGGGGGGSLGWLSLLFLAMITAIRPQFSSPSRMKCRRP
jgi:uncharacterized delta-60 repeat protein